MNSASVELFSSVKGHKIRVWSPRRPRGALRGLDQGLASTGGAGSRAYAARRCPISPGEKGPACSIARNTIVCMSLPLANGSPCRTDSSLGRAGRCPSRKRAVIAAWPWSPRRWPSSFRTSTRPARHGHVLANMARLCNKERTREDVGRS